MGEPKLTSLHLICGLLKVSYISNFFFKMFTSFKNDNFTQLFIFDYKTERTKEFPMILFYPLSPHYFAELLLILLYWKHCVIFNFDNTILDTNCCLWIVWWTLLYLREIW